MTLLDIDKRRYRKHLNLVFGAIAVTLIVLSLAISTLLIELLGTPGGSNFWLNLSGVVVSGAVVVVILHKLRPHPFMREVVYVWDLKQQLNRIYRKQRKLQSAVDANDPDALVTMNFFYRGSKQLYELDDNLVTHDELVDKIRHHDKLLEAAGLPNSTDAFEPSMLEKF